MLYNLYAIRNPWNLSTFVTYNSTSARTEARLIVVEASTELLDIFSHLKITSKVENHAHQFITAVI